jgi:hypothetical protein
VGTEREGSRGFKVTYLRKTTGDREIHIAHPGFPEAVLPRNDSDATTKDAMHEAY